MTSHGASSLNSPVAVKPSIPLQQRIPERLPSPGEGSQSRSGIPSPHLWTWS